MIHVELAAEPADFDEKVRKPGTRLLYELTGDSRAGKRRGPKRKAIAKRIDDIPVAMLEKSSYWTEALPELMSRYRYVCAYLGMAIQPWSGGATIDHFVPKSLDRRLAYEWSNFRLASRPMNTNKQDAMDVLDPCTIENGWFVLKISNFEVDVSPALRDEKVRAQVRQTIVRLHLNDKIYCDARQYYHDRYLGLVVGKPPLPLDWLEEGCPFVASELRRQKRLRPEHQKQAKR